nr:thioesterase family protein [Sphingomonas sp. Y57]
MKDETADESFQRWVFDNVRYADTDRQGHVNNAIFATFCETGRVELIYSSEAGLILPGTEFVIARLEIDYLAELGWPGQIAIGTTVASVGRSSLTLSQALFQNGKCAARAKSVIVLIDQRLRRSAALPPGARDRLLALPSVPMSDPASGIR